MGMGRWMGVLAGVGLMFLSTEARADGVPTLAPEHCEHTGCGTNTPVLFGTPIQGLRLDATPSTSSVVLDPKLERVLPWPGKGCQPGVVLGIERGRMVGKTGLAPSDPIVCRGEDMFGMIFSLKIATKTNSGGPTTFTVKVRIRDAGDVWTWEQPSTTSRPTLLPTFGLVWHDLDEANKLADLHSELRITEKVGESICPRRDASWMEPWQYGKQYTYAGQKWGAITDHVLIVQGETYDSDGSIEGGPADPNWFNIACPQTSIAKMRLLGLDPMRDRRAPARAERQATLKMLTGRYQGPKSYTSAGMPLKWERSGGPAYFGAPAIGTWDRKVIEAYWGETGAICVSHRRTWKSIGRECDIARATPEAAPQAPVECRPAKPTSPALVVYPFNEEPSLSTLRRPWFRPWWFRGLPTCARPPRAGSYFWITYPVHHVRHPLGPPPP
jgi:ADYC domain